MDSKKHTEFTQSPTAISRQVGGEFSTFNGWASGATIEMVPDKRNVPKWLGADWPEGHYSTVTFELTGQPNKTLLVVSSRVSLKIFAGSQRRLDQMVLG
ncbi:MAG: SRPBCC domain-containing protein [Halobacteriota archaeon]|jgi:activator of HSP90 ATPase